jgi:hypothetical protein
MPLIQHQEMKGLDYPTSLCYYLHIIIFSPNVKSKPVGKVHFLEVPVQKMGKSFTNPKLNPSLAFVIIVVSSLPISALN